MKCSWRKLGQILQGLVLGAALSVAILMVAAEQSGGRVFQYQGF